MHAQVLWSVGGLARSVQEERIVRAHILLSLFLVVLPHGLPAGGTCSLREQGARCARMLRAQVLCLVGWR